MSNYDELDRLILSRVGAHGVRFACIAAGAVWIEADRIADELGRKAYRVIEERLQSLRRAGKIKFDSKAGWTAASIMTTEKIGANMDIIDRLEVERIKDLPSLAWNNLLTPRADLSVRSVIEVGQGTEYEARLVVSVRFVANALEYEQALQLARENLSRALYADFHEKARQVIGLIYAHERDGALLAAQELLSLINSSCRKG
ncbi:MAG: hypothetical protein IPN69_08620 [Acidobacteria bacterium]|nr:hypothetical protein [Acidobacteriota bacterium]